MTVRILLGDARQRLADLPDGSVSCCVTSPPYFGLRDYGHDGQMGLEQSPAEFVAELVGLFREVRRVLRDDGTLWLNLGDSYAQNGRSGLNNGWESRSAGFAGGGKTAEIAHNRRPKQVPTGLKPKDLIGIPWRVAFALQDDGWWLRQDIVWSKPNPMPESVDDRCTKSHEYLFLMSKSQTYHYDAEAIMEGLTDSTISRMAQDVQAQAGSFKVPGKTNGSMKPAARSRGVPPRHAQYESSDQSGLDNAARGLGRNKRSVWTVATTPLGLDMCTACRHVYQPRDYRALRRDQVWDGDVRRPDVIHCQCGRTDSWLSHFATFPQELVRDCILAGCPAGGTVLDPFGGAGTTGLVADRLGREAILIELNPDYADLARARLRSSLTQVASEAPEPDHVIGGLFA